MFATYTDIMHAYVDGGWGRCWLLEEEARRLSSKPPVAMPILRMLALSIVQFVGSASALILSPPPASSLHAKMDVRSPVPRWALTTNWGRAAFSLLMYNRDILISAASASAYGSDGRRDGSGAAVILI